MNESDSSNNENEKSDEWKPEFFLSVLVHELRTPLIAIKGYIGILSNEEAKEQHPRAFESISKNIERIEKVIEGIADYRGKLNKRNKNA